MRTVHEVSEISGVSVRTLHHYDAIGLLKPTEVTEAGYRLYDEAALARLQTILLFRELQFPLREIRVILDRTDFDRKQALAQQIGLLELQRKRLGALITFARELEQTGVETMDFSAFDKAELRQYAAEAKEKWGATEAYREFARKDAGETKSGRDRRDDRLMAVFAEMGDSRHLPPDSPEAHRLVEKLRQCMTDGYYRCTLPLLRGLGEMYDADGRFREQIDRAGGSGTAAFAARAIAAYCRDAAE